MAFSVIKQCSRWLAAAALAGLGLVAGAAHAGGVHWSFGLRE